MSEPIESRLKRLPYGIKDAIGAEFRFMLEWVPPEHCRREDGYATGIWSSGYYLVGSAYLLSDHNTLEEAVAHLEAEAEKVLTRVRDLRGWNSN